MKKAESEPTVFGMGLIPLAISGVTMVIGVMVVLTARSITLSVAIVVVWIIIVFLSNYIYNSNFWDRMADNQQPTEIHNDIH